MDEMERLAALITAAAGTGERLTAEVSRLADAVHALGVLLALHGPHGGPPARAARGKARGSHLRPVR